MQSTFSGIELGKRGLIAHNQALQTVGHNLSNASTEGYSRQRVELRATDPLYLPQLNREERPGQIGQGVDVAVVERIKDTILEGRIVAHQNAQTYWESRDKYILMLEQVYNEPSALSVRTLLDKFWESWQDLSLSPSEGAVRKSVLERGQALMDGIHERYNSLKSIRDMLELEVTSGVEQINRTASDIAALNEQIVKAKAMGDNPNDLLDRRDLLVNKLSGMVDITVDNRDADEFTVHTGGMILVQGRVPLSFKAVMDPENEGYSKVVWSHSGETAQFRGGKLASFLELRDEDLREEIQKLDLMTVNLADMVNDIHRNGYGVNGKTNIDFFNEYPAVLNIDGNFDRNGDGAFDSTYIFRITGSHSLNPQEQVGLRGTITLSGPAAPVQVDYFPTDTVEDIIRRINTSGSEVMAGLDMNGKLFLKATPAAAVENPDFVIRQVGDTDQFLAGYAGLLAASGPEGAFRFDQADAVRQLGGGEVKYAVAPLAHPAGWIELNADLKSDIKSLAAGFGENGRPAQAGDGSAALAIANLRNTPVMIGEMESFDEYFAQVVADIGLKGETAARALDTQNAIMKDLNDLKQSISGVNIDEELSNMIKYQHGYAAAARFVSAVDKMLETIINRLGV